MPLDRCESRFVDWRGPGRERQRVRARGVGHRAESRRDADRTSCNRRSAVYGSAARATAAAAADSDSCTAGSDSCTAGSGSITRPGTNAIARPNSDATTRPDAAAVAERDLLRVFDGAQWFVPERLVSSERPHDHDQSRNGIRQEGLVQRHPKRPTCRRYRPNSAERIGACRDDRRYVGQQQRRLARNHSRASR